MNKSQKKLLYVSLLSGGAALLTAVYRMSQKAAVKFLQDTDSKKIDQMERVDAEVDPEVQDPAQPDSEYQVTNCFPQMQLEDLEKESNTKSNYGPNL